MNYPQDNKSPKDGQTKLREFKKKNRLLYLKNTNYFPISLLQLTSSDILCVGNCRVLKSEKKKKVK